ncbi:MAG: O-antigen ligase family protein [Anaerolineae bacterium]|nr:O-antigen ligase family protein [Anaerolineae bacterium]
MLNTRYRDSRLELSKRQFRWLPVILVALYFIDIWHPAGFVGIEWRWYTVLGLAGITFLLQGSPIDSATSRLYLTTNGLIIAGAILSLPRANDGPEAMYNAVGLTISVFTFFLFSQVLLSLQSRRVILCAMFLPASLWAWDILRLTSERGELARFLFVGENWDKNYHMLLFSLAVTALITFAVFWKPPEHSSRTVLIRLMSVALALFFAFAGSLMYSRSGMLALSIGALGAVMIGIAQLRSRGRLTIIVGAIGFAVLIGFLLEGYLAMFPFWNTAIERVTNPELVEEFNQGRLAGLTKSQSIIAENPIIGVGLGQFKELFVETGTKHNTGLLAHNTYLATWAETGIVGLMGILYWLFAVGRLLRRGFGSLPLVDKCWILMGIPYFLMLAMLDLGTNMQFMLIVHSAICADAKRIEAHADAPRLSLPHTYLSRRS